MIVLRQAEPNLLRIDFSQEKRFEIGEDGVELCTGLFVKDVEPKAIVVEDGGQPGRVLAYIRSSLTERGFDVRLDKALAESLKRIEEEEQLVRAIRGQQIKRIPFTQAAQFKIKRRLLKHQARAVSHALAVQNAANFSVPGSGKTTVALTVYSALRHDRIVDRMLVIGPASSFVPWEDEFYLTFGRKPNTLRLVGNSQKRSGLLRNMVDIDLVLCTYQMAYRERENLRATLRRSRYFFVLDESHYIKNIELGPWASTALDLAPFAARRMILTGTPAPHSLRDLWSQFTFLWPTEAVLHDRVSFEQRTQAGNAVAQLKKELLPFFARTKKSDLGLPKPVTNFEEIPYRAIPKRQRLIIRLIELKTLQQARAIGLASADIATIRQWRRARTIRLMQAASNPALLSLTAGDLGDAGDPLDGDPALGRLLENYEKSETPAKVEWVVKTVRRLVSQGRKVVVWGYFIRNLLLLKNLLNDLEPLLAYGGVPAYEEDADPNFESRERNIREFKTRKDRPLLIANPGACSESISLHMVCHDAVYLERTFNCGQFLQSMDRIHRVGMPPRIRPTYHIPIIPCAIERVLNQRLKDRQQTLYRLLDDDMPVLGFEDDSMLLEQEDDLEAIFRELLKEISKGVSKVPGRAVGRTRPRRGAK